LRAERPALGACGCVTVFYAMDLHRLAEERSVAYHSAIAERLRDHPEILENARRRVQEWLASRERERFYVQKWEEVLKGDVASVAAFLVERSELAVELRQSSPFAGALRPQERWKIWRETRERFLEGP
jgi:hypothetical protein